MTKQKTAQIIDFNDYKYGKIAEEFIRLRKTDPTAAARYARESVPAENFTILSKYIELELMRNGEYEPNVREDDEE